MAGRRRKKYVRSNTGCGCGLLIKTLWTLFVVWPFTLVYHLTRLSLSASLQIIVFLAKLLTIPFQPPVSTRPSQIKSYAQPTSYRYMVSESKSGVPSSDGPEERVRQYAIKLLIENYGFHKDDIEIEFPVKMGRQKKRADIVVFYPGYPHLPENIVIIVECKREDISSNNEAVEQLKSYMSAIPNATYGVVASNQWKVIKRVNDRGRHTFQFIPELPGADGEFVPVQYQPSSYVAETSTNRPLRSTVAHAPRSVTASTPHPKVASLLLIVLVIAYLCSYPITLTNNSSRNLPVVTPAEVRPLPTAANTATPHQAQPTEMPVRLPTRISATPTPDMAQNSLEPTWRLGIFVMNTSNSIVAETATPEHQHDVNSFGSERPTQNISLSSTTPIASAAETSLETTRVLTIDASGATNPNSPGLPAVAVTIHNQYLLTHLPEIYWTERTRNPRATETLQFPVPPDSSTTRFEGVDPVEVTDMDSNRLVRGYQKVEVEKGKDKMFSTLSKPTGGWGAGLSSPPTRFSRSAFCTHRTGCG